MTKDIEAVREEMAARARPFADAEGLADLVERFADRRVICLGEATHGTSEFYRARAVITERLVSDHGFRIVAIEGDWPDAAAWNATIGGHPAPRASEEPFSRFPRWMWRNAEARDLLDRLRSFNSIRPGDDRAGFYGLDMYSLCASIDAVLDYLEMSSPEAARDARALYGCLKPYCGDPGQYIRKVAGGAKASCEEAVVEVLGKLLRERLEDGEAVFGAEQNARLVANAEAYYRSMYSASERSWNLRDTHMFETLERLMTHHGPDARAVVWAHNSHLGDARATEMGTQRGELNIGQLVRERWGQEAALIGFSTDTGTVAAASDWGAPMEIKSVRPALPGSWEDCARRTGIDTFLLDLAEAPELLRQERLERAIGVIYRPETERPSHYFEARLADQFDAWIWFRETHAVRADEGMPRAEEPELFPFGV